MENSLIVSKSAGEVTTAELTFDGVVDLWFNSDSMAYVCDQSKKSYRKSLKAWQEWCTAKGIQQPTKQDLKDWRKEMEAEVKAETRSAATCNLRLTTVRNFYAWLKAEHNVPNIAEGLKGLKETKEHGRGYLTTPEMKQLLAVVEPVTQQKLVEAKTKGKTPAQIEKIILQGLRDKAILATLMAAGLRTIEINRLLVADLKPKGGITYLAVLGKGKTDRVDVKISRPAEQLIREWLKAREAYDTFDKLSPMFISLGNNSFGKPLSSNSVSTLCKEYLQAAGLKTPDIVAHSLRHSLAHNAIDKGVNPLEVQQQLRHSNFATTQIYIHEVNKAKNQVTDIISAEIF